MTDECWRKSQSGRCCSPAGASSLITLFFIDPAGKLTRPPALSFNSSYSLRLFQTSFIPDVWRIRLYIKTVLCPAAGVTAGARLLVSSRLQQITLRWLVWATPLLNTSLIASSPLGLCLLWGSLTRWARALLSSAMENFEVVFLVLLLLLRQRKQSLPAATVAKSFVRAAP